MKKNFIVKRLLLLIALLSLENTAFCQEPIIINPTTYDLYPLMKQNLIPLQNADEQPKPISDLPNAVLRYQHNVITTELINQLQKKPDPYPVERYTLVLPDLVSVRDTLLVMVGLENKARERTVNTLLIGSEGKNLVYFIDYNNNYNFTDDGEPLRFRKKTDIKTITIRSAGKNEQFTYLLYDLAQFPQYLQTYGVDLSKSAVQTTKEPMFAVPLLSHQSRLNASFGFMTGSGGESFSFATVDGVEKEYVATIDAISLLSASVSYAFKNLNLGVEIGYEGNQIGQTNYRVNGFTNYNIGKWPRKRFLYGAFIEYDIRLYRNLYFTPSYHVFKYNYLKTGPFQGYGNDLNREYTHNTIFQNRQGERYGAKIKLPVSEKVLFYAELGYVRNHLEVNSNFIQEAYQVESLEAEYSTFNYGFGCQILLLNPQ